MTQPHLETLRDLNHNYVRSVDQADVKWFDQNLAQDFVNTNPDGTRLDRAAFLKQIGRGSPVKDIREHDVQIRVLGEFAIIHARTSYTKPDGSTGGGWYTDDWQLGPEGWRCVSAHVSRS
ncbi:MAG: nuclear transport factor 2 family protein [Reyranella sp.]|nr:nuclear transport factor 2 family protein [Reyranella sp.]